MRINISRLMVLFLSSALLSIFLFGCDEKPPVERKEIKIVFNDFSSVLFEQSGVLSDDARKLFSGLESTNNKCKYTYIIDPLLIRSDLSIDTSIATKIEKSAIAATTPTRVVKLVQKQLEDLVLSSRFLQKPASKERADSLFSNFISTEINNDILLIYSDKQKSDSLTFNNKRYEVLTTVDDIRSRVLDILCQNSKASIAILINPPIVGKYAPLTLKVVGPDCKTGKLYLTSSGGDGSVIDFSSTGLQRGRNNNEFIIPESKRSGFNLVFNATQSGTAYKIEHKTECLKNGGEVTKTDKSNLRKIGDNGDLTIIKGSEGCDICTHYYSATDNIGHTRQILERNSTNCCPCGKTIEIKGRSYRMECNGVGNNRLALVE